MRNIDDTICALATPQGKGALALIRLSGADSFRIIDNLFRFRSKTGSKLHNQAGNTIHFGEIFHHNLLIDEVLISVFRSPRSYTGEDLIEISCHGSGYIQQTILTALLDSGARLAEPGEFTLRAFMNGKMDLSQAEAVADLIASNSRASHQLAMNQMRGGFSSALANLRLELLNLISLIELELDFSEEDVEFADRKQLFNLLTRTQEQIDRLKESFELGNVMKEGVSVAIVGNPNVGKSTLLNILLKEERALVSEIAGTTRDSIEETCTINGVLFRFIDTAGLRETSDVVERMGIQRSLTKIDQAKVVLLLLDATDTMINLQESIRFVDSRAQGKKLLLVLNKIDLSDSHTRLIHELQQKVNPDTPIVHISAKLHSNLDVLTQVLYDCIMDQLPDENEVIVSNMRHYEALSEASKACHRALKGMDTQLPTDLLAIEIRHVLHHIGSITGTLTTNEVLGNIFKNFCIGK